jgi:hypothetical protein
VRGSLLWMLVAFTAAGCGVVTPDEPALEPDSGYVWSSVDVGRVGVAGGVVPEAGGERLVVVGSGADVWGEADGFHFAYQVLRGDGSLTVRVEDFEAAHYWSKAGVMVREDLSPGARNAFIHLTESEGVLFQRREVPGGSTSNMVGMEVFQGPAAAPWWLRIERRGDTVIGSHSANGSSWSELGRYSLDLPEEVLVGTAVTSRTNDAVARGVFSNVTLMGERGDAPPPDDGDDGGGALPPVPITGPTVSASYTRSTVDFPNPERGWHGYGGSPSSYARSASDGFTLVRRYVRLDDYRYQELPASFLQELRSDLAALREHGLKVILRFSYNFGREDDAPRDRVLQHIAQVAPVLQEYTDVIAVMQAGFIGAWGEWHSSTHDLLTLENRTAITNALLGALDESRMIQIRYPYRARDMFPTPPNATTAFTGSDASRVGQVNDCFVSSSSDGGTFIDQADYDYMEAVTRYTVMGGETCAIAGVNSRNDGHVAVAEMTRFHFDYLNHDFYEPIIDKWRSQGYYDEISRRLGYRYVMLETTSQESVAAGDTFSLNVRVENEGFGKLYNPRPINVVLRPAGGGTAITLRANDDARTAMPLAGETRTVGMTVRIPDSLPAGAYDVYLSLPDPAATLANDPRYAIRFANHDVWEASTGRNALNVQLIVTNN